MSDKPILLLCGCQKYREYLEAAIRRFQRPEWELIAIIGSDEPAHLDPATRILTLPVPDTYEALPRKIHAAFAWIAKERPGTRGVFKTDDDMWFDTEVLAKTILKETREYWGVKTSYIKAAAINSGRIEERFEDRSLQPSHQTAAYCFGWGYWISEASIPLIVQAKEDYTNSYLEDVCTGFVLNRQKITPVIVRIPYKEYLRGPELLALK